MKTRTAYYCVECGAETPKWQGRCPECGSWNTVVEQPAEARPKSGAARRSGAPPRAVPKRISELEASSEQRFTTGLGELDRVLGGGAVAGSLVLVAGAPGIGKSTLLLQICGVLSRRGRVMYVSGEESERQLGMRAGRLGVPDGELYVLAETGISEIIAAAGALRPDVLIADSVQTLYSGELNSAPGSVSQVKECAMALLRYSKDSGVTVFLIGHVNKEGAIAGPRVLEHMVDCVLYFEGEATSSYRILRAAKNRFGPTNEIGVFEMSGEGLAEVPNPSEQLLSGRPRGTPGTCVTCVMEGARPILAEIQALVAPSSFNVPRRNSTGIDYNRAMMLLAVLEKRGGLRVSGCDAYINVIGGLSVDEPGADLATVLALASGYTDKPLDDDVVAIGEVGLTGELRPAPQTDARLAEAARLGFKRCVIPRSDRGAVKAPDGLEVVRARTIGDAIKSVMA
ncbi:MAG: DNA repair protein RadA [Oscillospiraceae bacterium]|nr:DNA repair protein RadA [Oscillospiraceae bacterium]